MNRIVGERHSADRTKNRQAVSCTLRREATQWNWASMMHRRSHDCLELESAYSTLDNRSSCSTSAHSKAHEQLRFKQQNPFCICEARAHVSQHWAIWTCTAAQVSPCVQDVRAAHRAQADGRTIIANPLRRFHFFCLMRNGRRVDGAPRPPQPGFLVTILGTGPCPSGCERWRPRRPWPGRQGACLGTRSSPSPHDGGRWQLRF